ncbi:hypothetical protein RJ639_017739 [Escallonia herrerae]|uniref:Uncharacterized protein n=1 Tax=Escallonia herrerae TaxID=1293975 RepID=A0AA88VGY4_9ASTE|nr:hypothetical protein RJ639_017739 [Escallonia herrerae]
MDYGSGPITALSNTYLGMKELDGYGNEPANIEHHDHDTKGDEQNFGEASGDSFDESLSSSANSMEEDIFLYLPDDILTKKFVFSNNCYRDAARIRFRLCD